MSNGPRPVYEDTAKRPDMLTSDIIQIERLFFELLTGQLAGYQALIKARTKQGLCVLVLDVVKQISQKYIDRWYNNPSFSWPIQPYLAFCQ